MCNSHFPGVIHVVNTEQTIILIYKVDYKWTLCTWLFCQRFVWNLGDFSGWFTRLQNTIFYPRTHDKKKFNYVF